jgi:predicted lipoprotein with Yx(FWY)xxD motif
MRLSIRHSVTVAIATGAAAALAACGGGGNGNATGASPGSGSGIVSIQSVHGTDVLVDSQGRTLYSARTPVEKGGRIRCTGACKSFWDPVGATANESKSASADLHLSFGVVKRPEGDRQLTFNGRPLYSFKEEGPGQLKGDGFVDDFAGTHFQWETASVRGGSGSAGSDAPSNSSPY